MTIEKLMEDYIITTKSGIIGIQNIKRHKITEKMGTIEFILANEFFLNKRNMISCFEFTTKIFEKTYKQKNTKFRIKYGEKMSLCKILITL